MVGGTTEYWEDKVWWMWHIRGGGLTVYDGQD